MGELARRGAFQPIWATARASLRSNIQQLGGKLYITAGRHQFKSLWTRDFCFAVPGLLAMGRSDVVHDQLTFLLDHLRPSDALVPRTADSIDAKWRTVLAAIKHVLPFLKSRPLKANLKPEYQDQHGSLAIDGNLLVLLASLRYVERSGDVAFWQAHEAQLGRALAFYDAHLDGGLISEPPFSDWQDSVRRAGKTFYTNLLYWTVLDRLARTGRLGVTRARADAVRAKLESTFKDPVSGLYRSVAGAPNVSLDGNLMAIDYGYLDPDSQAARALYAALKRHPLWTAAGGIPGACTSPDYPKSWHSFSTRLVGLEHYHDSIAWSWLSALAAKVAARMGDGVTATTILRKWNDVVERDGAVGEIYAPTPQLPLWHSWLYDSEKPFTWGAGTFVDALAYIATTGCDPSSDEAGEPKMS